MPVFTPFDNRAFANKSQIETFRYSGPDRRITPLEIGELLSTSAQLGEVTFDAKGNPVWQLAVEIPRRRANDEPVDLLECLDVDSLSLEDDNGAKDTPGYNPYGSGGKSGR